MTIRHSRVVMCVWGGGARLGVHRNNIMLVGRQKIIFRNLDYISMCTFPVDDDFENPQFPIFLEEYLEIANFVYF